MNDDDLVLAAYRVILNLVIPPLRSQKMKDIKIVWPCSLGGTGGDWTLAGFYFKNRLAFVLWCAEQHIHIGTPMIMPKIKPIGMPTPKVLTAKLALTILAKESIADPKCHVRILAVIVDLILKLRGK
jgi:hypothetical protein